MHKHSMPSVNPRQRFIEAACSWVVIIFLIALSVGLETRPPFRRYVLKANLYKYAYPLKPNTIPAWSVIVYSLFGPWLVMMLSLLFEGWTTRACLQFSHIPSFMKGKLKYIRKMSIALWFAVSLTAAATACIKSPVGALRPNFVARCWPDGNIQFEGAHAYTSFPADVTIDGGYPKCTGEEAVWKEGMKSFVSGHSSISMAGLGFLGYYLWYRLDVAKGKREAWRLFAGFVPFFLAVIVGVSRIVDYWHHVQDVVCGLLLGLLITTASFQQFAAESKKSKQSELQLTSNGHAAADHQQQQLQQRPVESIELVGKSVSNEEGGGDEEDQKTGVEFKTHAGSMLFDRGAV